MINNIKELKDFFKKNNINSSDDLSNLGLNYWNNILKPIINPKLFKKYISNKYPLLLVDTSGFTDFSNLFENNRIPFCEIDESLKTKKYWENPLNYIGFWNTENVTDISGCFYDQRHFNQKLYWNTEKIINVYEAFYNCINLDKKNMLKIKNNINIEELIRMYKNCKKIEKDKIYSKILSI